MNTTSSQFIHQDERLLRVMGSFIKKLKPSVKVNPENLIYIPLKGGGSQSTLYRFVLEQVTYVVRLFPNHANPLTRMHQMILAKQAGKIGVGPEIYFVDSQMEGMVMTFIDGRTVTQTDFKNNESLAQFAKLLQTLHQSTEKFPVAHSPFQRFHQFVEEGEKNKITYPFRFTEVKTLMEELEAIFRQNPVPQVPTHLDLHPLNIMLQNQRFFLVDWVNGGMCDPYFDLATFTTFQCLSEFQILTFLTHYFERAPTSYEWDRFIMTQPIRLFVAATALLNTSKDEMRSISYEEASQTGILPPLSALEKMERDEPLWQFGLTMLKLGLTFIDQKNFKSALQSMQRKT
jgi:thiamine kinase-like enzyme